MAEHKICMQRTLFREAPMGRCFRSLYKTHLFPRAFSDHSLWWYFSFIYDMIFNVFLYVVNQFSGMELFPHKDINRLKTLASPVKRPYAGRLEWVGTEVPWKGILSV